MSKPQAWFKQNNCAVKDLQKKTVATLLEDTELPPNVQRVLELRQDYGQAAVKKITALLKRAGADDRVRGSLIFHKASTGRWAGEGFQPQNLKHPEVEDLEAAIAAVRTGDYEHVRSLYPRALSLLGDLGRSLIIAPPAHTLIGADFSAIESRVLAWVAGEQWKLDAYSRYDATQDPRDEPYCVLACRMLHVPDGSFTPQSPERKIGKTGDLACGYMGGAGAIEKFAPGVFDEAERNQIKNEWRAAHPNIKKFWYEIDRAAWDAVQNRGSMVRCGPVAFRCVGTFLFLKLPSRPQARLSPRPNETVSTPNTGRAVQKQFQRTLARLSRRPRCLRRHLDGKHRAGDRPRLARGRDAARRSCRVSNRAACA